MSKILSIDVGYKFVKAAYNNQTLKYPSNIEALGQVINGFGNKDYITYNGEKYLVAEDCDTPIPTRNFDFLIKFTPLFIYYTAKRLGINLDEIENIKLGLSLLNVLNKDKKLEYIYQLQKEFIFDDKKISFNNITHYVQGTGIYNVFKANHPEKIENVFVIDIGHNTLDALSFKNDKPNPKYSSANNHGVNVAIKEIITLIKNNHSIEIDEDRATNVLLTKEFTFQGDTYSYKKEIISIVNNYVNSILTELKTKFPEQFNFADYIVFGGGGVYLLKNNIQTQKNFVFIEYPEFGNVIGY